MSLLAGLLAVAVLGMQAGTAARPDFSGRWTLIEGQSTRTPTSASTATIVGLLGERFTATQDDRRLSLAISATGRVIDAVYHLDGSESRNVNPGGPGRPDEFIYSRASWYGGRLVIVTRNPIPAAGDSFESRREIWIDTEDRLVIERHVAGSPTLRSVYRREP